MQRGAAVVVTGCICDAFATDRKPNSSTVCTCHVCCGDRTYRASIAEQFVAAQKRDRELDHVGTVYFMFEVGI